MRRRTSSKGTLKNSRRLLTRNSDSASCTIASTRRGSSARKNSTTTNASGRGQLAEALRHAPGLLEVQPTLYTSASISGQRMTYKCAPAWVSFV